MISAVLLNCWESLWLHITCFVLLHGIEQTLFLNKQHEQTTNYFFPLFATQNSRFQPFPTYQMAPLTREHLSIVAPV